VQGVLPLIGAQRHNRAVRLCNGLHWRGRPHKRTFCCWRFHSPAWRKVFLPMIFRWPTSRKHSNTQLPAMYRFAAVWGGHEGSLLLWVLMLAGWGAAVSLASRQLPEVMVARVLGGAGSGQASACWLSSCSPPIHFDRLLPAAAEGRDLNPLLQDPGLVFHPPMLYMGYVGFAVAFAFAIAALISGRLDAAWARWSRPWTTAAWCFLTIGIALGSWWAYYELGWGGWWFWDPVENASFMPWLVGHGADPFAGHYRKTRRLQELDGAAGNCRIFAVAAGHLPRAFRRAHFSACLSPPTRAAGCSSCSCWCGDRFSSLTLFAWRAPKVSAGGAFALVSRETMLLMNNVLLVVATGSVLLGTLYPLLIDALGLGKLSVGPPYFNTVFVPVMVPLLLLIAVGPLARWKQADLRDMARRLRLSLVLALLAGIILPQLMGGGRR
jgi:cytochrome c-type biogenesis protein CcmF